MKSSLKYVPLVKHVNGKRVVVGTAEIVVTDDGERMTGHVRVTDPELAKRIMGPPGSFTIKEFVK
jgi:hypothetical protein